MPVINITYHLSEKGRKANLLSGGNGQKFQLIVVEMSDPSAPELMEAAVLSKTDSNAWVELGHQNGGPKSYMGVVKVHDYAEPYQVRHKDAEVVLFDDMFLSPLEALCWLREQDPENQETLERWKSEIDRKKMSRMAAIVKWLKAGFLGLENIMTTKNHEYGYVEWVPSKVDVEHCAHPEKFVGIEAEAVSGILPDLLAVCSARNETARRTWEEEKAKKDAALKDIAAEANEWALLHGSPRLRLAVQVGLMDAVWGLYAEERMYQEFPDWELARRGLKEHSILNPELADLEALQVWRSKLPAATLVSLEIVDGNGTSTVGPAIKAPIGKKKMYLVL